MSNGEFIFFVTKLVLKEIGEYGYVLSGEQAAIIYGFVDRTTADVALTTSQFSTSVLPTARVKAVNVLRSFGFVVVEDESVLNSNIFKFYVRDLLGRVCNVELGYGLRAFSPVLKPIGPVVDVRDYAAAKMNTFLSRLEIGDTLELFGLWERGGFTGDALIALATSYSSRFQLEDLVTRLRYENRRASTEFEEYGLDEVRVMHVVRNISIWAGEIEKRLIKGALHEERSIT